MPFALGYPVSKSRPKEGPMQKSTQLIILGLILVGGAQAQSKGVSLKKVRTIFSKADANQDGLLNRAEATAVGIPQRDMVRVDADKSGDLSGEEFVFYYSQLLTRAGRAPAKDLELEAKRITDARRAAKAKAQERIDQARADKQAKDQGRADQARTDSKAKDQARIDQARADKQAKDQGRADQARTDSKAKDQARIDQARADKQAKDQGRADQARTDSKAKDQARIDQARADKQAKDQGRADQARTDSKAKDQARIDQARADKQAKDQGRADQARTDSKAKDQARIDQARADKQAKDQGRADQARTDSKAKDQARIDQARADKQAKDQGRKDAQSSTPSPETQIQGAIKSLRAAVQGGRVSADGAKNVLALLTNKGVPTSVEDLRLLHQSATTRVTALAKAGKLTPGEARELHKALTRRMQQAAAKHAAAGQNPAAKPPARPKPGGDSPARKAKPADGKKAQGRVKDAPRPEPVVKPADGNIRRKGEGQEAGFAPLGQGRSRRKP